MSPPKLLRETRIFIPTEVLKSNSLINAVRNYVYQPTLVNGEPVGVRTMVNFKILSPFH